MELPPPSPAFSGSVPMRKGYADTPWGQVHYRSWGRKGAQPTLVLLHQTASSSAMYEAIAPALARHAWVVAPDTPGFGESFRPLEAPTIAWYTQVLRAFFTDVGGTQAYLFGHHTGASIAAQWAVDDPSRIQKLALFGPPCLTSAQRKAALQKVDPVVVRADGSHWLHHWKRLQAKDPAASPALLHRELLLTMSAGERYHEAYGAVFDHDLAPILARVQCPTLLLSGDEDSLRECLEPSLEALRKSSLPPSDIRKGWIAGASTYVCDRHADALVGELNAFFFGASA